MHKHVTHNRTHASFPSFRAEIIAFLRHRVPQRWSQLCDNVSDEFRVIDPTNYRMAG